MESEKVIKFLDSLTDEQRQAFRLAENQFIENWCLFNPSKEMTLDFVEAIRVEVIAMGRPLDDSSNYFAAQISLGRKARERKEAEELENQRRAAEAQQRKAGEEYLRPSNRAEAARELQQNQPAPIQGSAQLPPVSSRIAKSRRCRAKRW